MPTASTTAFVLGSSTFGEQDRLVHLLTTTKGIIKAVAPGSMKAKNRFGSLFELFTEGEFIYNWRENRELITISKGEILQSYFNIVSRPESIFYFYLISDVFKQFVPVNHRDNRLYRLLNAILTEREKNVDMTLLILYFLLWILRIEGMMFNPRICHNCFEKSRGPAWLKSDYQGILCGNCRTDEKTILQPEELTFLRWTERNAPSIPLSWLQRIDVPKLIRTFTRKIEHHGECTLKSSHYLSEFR
jgi:DNA repair protein RecO